MVFVVWDQQLAADCVQRGYVKCDGLPLADDTTNVPVIIGDVSPRVAALLKELKDVLAEEKEIRIKNAENSLRSDSSEPPSLIRISTLDANQPQSVAFSHNPFLKQCPFKRLLLSTGLFFNTSFTLPLNQSGVNDCMTPSTPGEGEYQVVISLFLQVGSFPLHGKRSI